MPEIVVVQQIPEIKAYLLKSKKLKKWWGVAHSDICKLVLDWLI